MTRTLLASILVLLLPATGIAWPWGPKSYEECMAEEMKGRQKDQIGLVMNSCRKRFPAIPTFKRPTHFGSLRCFSKDLSASFDITVTERTLQAGAGSFAVLFRDAELVEAESKTVHLKPDWIDGTRLVINFSHGLGSFDNVRDHRQQITFECKENATK